MDAITEIVCALFSFVQEFVKPMNPSACAIHSLQVHFNLNGN